MALSWKAVARTALVLIAAMLAFMALRLCAASSLASTDPARAAAFAPGNARAAVAAAEARVPSGANVGSEEARALVRTALDRDVTIPAAIELRALDLQLAGDAERAERLYALSNAISRRSLPTRLWLIQRSVDNGDVAGALKNFDLALRTSAAAPEILFPVLAGATTDPGLVKPIAAVLDRPSDWRAMFLAYAIGEGRAAPSTADVVLAMRDRPFLIDKKIDRALIGRLVEAKRFAKARRVDAAFRGAASHELLRDSRFSDVRALYPFGWELSDTSGAGAARDLVAGGPALTYRSQSGAAGPVAVQLLTLQPGRHRLATRNAAAPADPASAPAWTVTCSDGPQITLLPVPRAKQAVASRLFTVPADCPGQWIALVLRASDAADGQSGAIRSVSIERL